MKNGAISERPHIESIHMKLWFYQTEPKFALQTKPLRREKPALHIVLVSLPYDLPPPFLHFVVALALVVQDALWSVSPTALSLSLSLFGLSKALH